MKERGSSQGEGPPMWTFPLSQLPPRGARLIPIPFFPSCSVTWESFLLLWLYKRSNVSFQLVFCEIHSTCRCIFDVFVGEGELRILLPLHLNPPPASLHTGLLSIAELSKPFPPAFCYFSSLCLLCSFSGSSHD